MPEGFVFGPSPSYMNLEGILASAEAEVAHPMVRVAAENLTVTLTATAPRVDFDDTLKRMLERAHAWRRDFPPERVPAGNYDHPIGPKTMDVYWVGLITSSWGSAVCFLCDVQWSFSDTGDRATCWCCGRSEDRPQD